MSSFRQLMMRKKGGGEKSVYLEAKDGAYINLAGIPNINQSDTFSCTFQIPDIDTATSNVLGYVFGIQLNSNNGLVLYGGDSTKSFFGRFGMNYFTITSLTPKADKHTYERKTDIFLNSSYNALWLFANNYSGGKYSNLTVRFWGLSFSNSGGTKSIDLVPAIENGVAGVKDLISGNFYGNSGSGTITFVEE